MEIIGANPPWGPPFFLRRSSAFASPFGGINCCLADPVPRHGHTGSTQWSCNLALRIFENLVWNWSVGTTVRSKWTPNIKHFAVVALLQTSSAWSLQACYSSAQGDFHHRAVDPSTIHGHQWRGLWILANTEATWLGALPEQSTSSNQSKILNTPWQTWQTDLWHSQGSSVSSEFWELWGRPVCAGHDRNQLQDTMQRNVHLFANCFSAYPHSY